MPHLAHCLARLSAVPLWLRVALLCYLGWLALLYVSQDSFLFHPGLARPSGVPLPDGTARLDRPIAGGAVYAWFVPAARAGERAPLVVAFHGNGGLAENATGLVEGYRQLGCAVLLPEYRGYGQAAGRPSEAALVGDAAELLELALQRPDVDGRRVVYHGHSLGGGVAAALAARRPPAALVLQSTFTSIACMSWRYLAPPFLARNPFRTDRVLPGFDLPILIIHGTDDQLVSPDHAHRLAALNPRARLVEYPGGHIDLPGADQADDYWWQIAQTLQAAGVIPAGTVRAESP